MILLLGASGYLGQAFADEMHARKLSFVPLSRENLDYTRLGTLFNYVRSAKPDFIINAAGYTGRPDLDECESARADTVRANTLLPQTVARACYLTKIPLGHVSSGSIYSGAKLEQEGGWRIVSDLNEAEARRTFEAQPDRFLGFAETEPPNFTFHSPRCSVYSGSKALAEEALGWFAQAYLWRPGVVFDEADHPRNEIARILRTARLDEAVNSYSHRRDFVRACLDLWEGGAPFGAYNMVNPGSLTGRQIAEAIRHGVKASGPWEFPPSPAEPSRPCRRAPRSSCLLDTSKLQAAGVRLRPVRDALREALGRWQPAGRTFNR